MQTRDTKLMRHLIKQASILCLTLVMVLGFPVSAIADEAIKNAVDNVTVAEKVDIDETLEATKDTNGLDAEDALTLDSDPEVVALQVDSAEANAATDNTASRVTYSCPALSEAQAAIVVDGQGNIIFSKNIDAEFNMASITKIMTAVVALENGFDMNAQIACQGTTLDANAQLAGYTAGMTVSASDLWAAMLVYSANDAAYEIATSVAGSETAFVKLMNAKAKELGMANTVFKNCHGLDADGHHSTASDLVKLARYAMTNYPAISDQVKRESVTLSIGGYNVYLESTDELLGSLAGAMGIKTGRGNNTTCFLGAARRGSLTLYSCVLGCETSDGRFNDTATLMNEAFNTAYQQTTLASTSLADTTHPFAYHFGWSVKSCCTSNVVGYAARAGADTIRSNLACIPPSELLVPGEQTKISQWTQDGKVVGTAIFTTTSELVQSKSGLGIAGKLLDNTEPYVDSAIVAAAAEYLAA